MLFPRRQFGRSHLISLGGIALLALFALGLAGYSVLAPSILSGWRLDMTENQQYTLSDGSRSILNNLLQTVSLKLYFSENASQDYPQIRQYADDVWNILQEMSQQSNGKLVVEKINPEPFSEIEDDAASLGLQAVPVPSGEQLYFGLVASNELDGLQVMPFLQPDKALFLEYDLAKMISGLANLEPQRVAWLSSLPAVPSTDPLSGQVNQGWEVYRQLEQLYEVIPVPVTANELPTNIDLLILAAPHNLSVDMAFSIEQFVLAGGRLLLFLDPLPEQLVGRDNDNNNKTGLEDLLQHWGIGFNPDQIVADLEYALQVSLGAEQIPVRHIAILGVRDNGMNQEEIVSADMDVINLSSSGWLQLSESSPLDAFILLETTVNAALLPLEKVLGVENPAELSRDFLATGEKYTLAARYQGLPDAVLALPEINKTDEVGATSEVTNLLQKAISPVQIIVFADSDLLADQFWVQQQAFFQQTVSSAFADNGNLIVNAVDNLLGSEELISIRARHVTQRPFSRVEQMRFAAEQRLRDQEQLLQLELQDIETRLQSMQNPDAADQLTSPEQQAEIQDYIEQRLFTRKQLRQVQQSLNQDIRQLGSRLKFINILLIPALVAAFSLSFFWWRTKSAKHK